MFYFDNAATTFPKPPQVTEAMIRALESFGNPFRGAHEASLEAARTVERCRLKTARLFGCRKNERVAFTANVTQALNIAIASLRGHIVTTAAEHNSVLRPVYRSGNYTLVGVDADGCYTAEDIARALRPDTVAVAVGHGGNLTGQINPIAEIGRLCRERKLIFIVDAAQSAGLIPIDMEAMGVDALCFTGHKSLYGPQGTGGICLSERFLPEPLLVGGSGQGSFEKQHPGDLPSRLEAGTVNGHGLAGLLAGLDYLTETGLENIFAAADRVARHFYRELAGRPGLTFYGRYEQSPRLPIVALNVEGRDSAEVAGILAEEHKIAVRAGSHCAPLLHETFGTQRRGAVRFSFSHFNTVEEADAAVAALKTLL